MPTYGFLSCAIIPILGAMLVPTIYPVFLKTVRAGGHNERRRCGRRAARAHLHPPPCPLPRLNGWQRMGQAARRDAASLVVPLQAVRLHLEANAVLNHQPDLEEEAVIEVSMSMKSKRSYHEEEHVAQEVDMDMME